MAAAAAAAATETLHVIQSDEVFNKKIEEAKASGKLVVVDFTASWCGPCKIIGPVFAEYSKVYTNVVFLKVDVDQLPAITSEWKVEAMPTFIFLKDGKCVDKIVGADKKVLEQKIKQYMTDGGSQAS